MNIIFSCFYEEHSALKLIFPKPRVIKFLPLRSVLLPFQLSRKMWMVFLSMGKFLSSVYCLKEHEGDGWLALRPSDGLA